MTLYSWDHPVESVVHVSFLFWAHAFLFTETIVLQICILNGLCHPYTHVSTLLHSFI